MANETIPVTGATGKVGQRLVPRLLSWREPGDEIRVLVRTPEAADRKRALDGATLVVNAAATFRSPAVTEADMLAALMDCPLNGSLREVSRWVRQLLCRQS